MSSRARLLTAILGVAAVIVAFVALRPDGHSSTTTSATTTATSAEPVATAPSGPVIRVKGGQPVGGVKDITVRQGGVIRLTVIADAAEEVHMHGYDIAKNVGPGAPAHFTVPAKINGVFEVELENSAVQIAKLTVNP